MKRKINKLVIFTTRESVFKNDLKLRKIMPLQATKKNSAKLNVMNTEISVVVGSDEVIFTNLRKKQTKTKRKTKRKSSY